MNDLTILLQGRIDTACLELWINEHSDKNVVLSIWEDEEYWKLNLPEKWELVINQYPLVRFADFNNFDYQLITTINGLKVIDTKYVIKMRCDEYWSNISLIYDMIKADESRIVSGSMFFRKKGIYKFHCSDKIIGSTVDNLKKMFCQTLENIKNNLWSYPNPEGQLGLGWIMSNENFDTGLLNPMNWEKTKFNFEQCVNQISNASNLVLDDIKGILSREFNPFYTNSIDLEKIKSILVKDKDILTECIKGIEKKNEKDFDDSYYMKRWFSIVDINYLKPYIATRNFGVDIGRVWYKDNFDNEAEDCVTNINLY